MKRQPCSVLILFMAFTALAQAAERNGVVEDPDSFDVRRIYLDWSGEDAGMNRRLIGRITSYTLRTPEGTVLRELTLEP